MRDGVFITPDVTSGILESVTRRTILEFAASAGVETVERTVGRRTELYLAEEAFYCGTGWKSCRSAGFDGRPVGDGAPGLRNPEAASRFRRYRPRPKRQLR